MAIYDVNEELSKQQKTGSPDIVKKGEGAGFMQALGYNPTTGAQNNWGKIFHAIPGASTITNLYAGGISKGTDVNKVIKAGRDEAIASDLDKAALGLEVFKLGATAGLGGGFGNGLSNGIARAMVGSSPNMLNDASGMSWSMNNVSESDLMNAKNSMSPGDYRRYVNAMGYNNTMGMLGSIGGVSNALARSINSGMAYSDELEQSQSLLHTKY